MFGFLEYSLNALMLNCLGPRFIHLSILIYEYDFLLCTSKEKQNIHEQGRLFSYVFGCIFAKYMYPTYLATRCKANNYYQFTLYTA